ncbi:Peptidyl-prolyl isomerase CWC27 [Candida viswanathii]|uniref:Peptidyl-prolyl isomerase CWC27 n=1 Tax=Candida viswanathii TaxID=5486 RepID=A0A367XZR8_9ASCO|nr:Peptidyl-prolyl isomerase CWC27 [Candida viswanathii]
MSSLEPQTLAKVILRTTKGPIEIDLWPEELPITSRSFLTSCLNQKFNDLEFLFDSNVVQFANPVEIKTVKESSLRIKCKRGYAGLSKDGESFFISLKEIPEFASYNIFGKINQDSYYNVLKITQGEVDKNRKLVFPVKVTSSEVVVPYFDDLVKEEEEKAAEPVQKKAKSMVKISYDDDDEEEDEFVIKSAYVVKKDKKPKKEAKEEVVEKVEVPKEEPQEEPKEEPEEEDEEEEVKKPVVRDPTIDSDYNSDLDLDNAVSISLSR